MALRVFDRADHSVAGDLAKAAMVITFVSLLAVGWVFATLSPDEAERWLRSEVPFAAEGAGRDRAAPAAVGALARRAAALDLHPCGWVQVK